VKPRGPKLLRAAALLVLLGVVVSVAAFLERSEDRAPDPRTLGEPAEREVPRLDSIRIAQLASGKEGFVLEAARMVGDEQEGMSLEEVKASFSFRAHGELRRATITSDSGEYTASPQKAVFRGRVRVETDDGLELKTEHLTYLGEAGRAFSEGHTEFEKGRLKGSSTDLVYEAERARVRLPAEVVLQIDSGTEGATEVKAGWGELLRNQGELELADGVDVERGGDRISSEKLRLSFSPDSQIVQRALFLGGTTLVTTGERPFGTSTFVPGGAGERRLESTRLDLAFTEEGSLMSAVAAPEASLEMRAQGPAGPEVRRVEGQPLGFHFDEQGRLKEVDGLFRSLLEIEAIPPSPARRETLRCKRFLAYLEPETGSLHRVEFFNDISYSGGDRRASADQASYEPGGVGLTLQNDAHLTDEGEGVDLSADVIYIQADSGDVEAQGDVRSLQRNVRALEMLASAEAPTIVLCSKFQYTAKDRTAHYEGGVVLRSRTNEIRAESIRLQRPAEGGGRLEATGSVAARLQPAAREGEETPPLVEASAGSLVYDGAAQRLVFEKDVTIHQGDIDIESPAAATLSLDSTGLGIEKLVAGEPVEVKAGPRKAKGGAATFTPADQTFVIVGDDVSLDDPELRLQGHTIQFRIGDDKVLVNGEERVRTEMILLGRPAATQPPKPAPEPPPKP